MPSHNTRRAALVCVGALMLVQVVSAQSHAEVSHSANFARAKALFHEATVAYNDAAYPRARSLFEEAHQLEPGAATWRALALCDYRIECFACAERELRAALAESRPSRMLSDTQQREALSLLRKIRARGGHLPLDVRAEQTIPVDRIALESAQHTLTVSAPSERAHPERVTIGAGQEHRGGTRLRQDQAPPVPPSSPIARASSGLRANRWRDTIRAAGTTRAVIGLSAGGLALAVGAVAGTVSIVETRAETERCVDTRCPPERAGAHQRANAFANVANVSLGVAALGIAYGLFELLTLPAPDTDRAFVVPTGAGATLHVPL